ncbi:hypothetical protein BDV95DRAFT_488823, partial [Massariosphaeria phaeospora]
PRVHPTYSQAERKTLDEWRTQTVGLIEARIKQYQKTPHAGPPRSVDNPLRQRNTIRSDHRVFHIPELLDKILHIAGVEAQAAAYYVSTVWRASAKSAIERKHGPESFWVSRPCSPVEYGQLIDPNIVWLQPTLDDISAFEDEFDCTIVKRRGKKLYFPARFTQLLAALQEVSTTTLSTWLREAEELKELVRTGHWVDNVWLIPGAPKLLLLLHNGAMSETEPDKN